GASIEEHDVWLELGNSPDSLLGASRRAYDRDVPCSAEEHRKALSIQPDVADDEDANRVLLRTAARARAWSRGLRAETNAPRSGGQRWLGRGTRERVCIHRE